MVFAFLLIAYGLATFLVAGNLIGGIWSVFLGWFLLSAARAEEASSLIRQGLSGISVAEVMTPSPVQAPDDISVEDALHGYVLASRHSTFPTHDAAGRLSGLLTMAALKAVAPDARAATLVKEVTCPLDKVSTASPGDPVTNLLGLSEGCSEGRTLVVDGRRLVGIVSPSDISLLVQSSLSGRSQASARRAQGLGQVPAGLGGNIPAGSTSRLIVLLCRPLALQDSRNVQQPAVGTSTMLGPPAMATTGWD
jgi:CBS domain-containing protein